MLPSLLTHKVVHKVQSSRKVLFLQQQLANPLTGEATVAVQRDLEQERQCIVVKSNVQQTYSIYLFIETPGNTEHIASTIQYKFDGLKELYRLHVSQRPVMPLQQHGTHSQSGQNDRKLIQLKTSQSAADDRVQKHSEATLADKQVTQ